MFSLPEKHTVSYHISEVEKKGNNNHNRFRPLQKPQNNLCVPIMRVRIVIILYETNGARGVCVCVFFPSFEQCIMII